MLLLLLLLLLLLFQVAKGCLTLRVTVVLLFSTNLYMLLVVPAQGKLVLQQVKWGDWVGGIGSSNYGGKTCM